MKGGGIGNNLAETGAFTPLQVDAIRRLIEDLITERKERHRFENVKSAPKRPRQGDLAYTDGVSWNPGSGAGVYYFNGTVWVLMGGGGGSGFEGKITVTFSSGNISSITTTIADAGATAASVYLTGISLESARDIDEMETGPVVVSVGNIVPGVGFDIIAVSLDGDATGKYDISYRRV